MRPCIVVFPPHGELVPGLLVSAQWDCHLPTDFEIRADHPDFPATGLTKECYVRDRLIDEPLIKFTNKGHRGELSGTLLTSFKKWLGL